MITLLLVPLLAPCAMPLLARHAVARLAPGAALRVLTLTVLVLAGSSLAALGTLVLTGLLRLPVFAALEKLVHPLDANPAALPLAAPAAGMLAVCAWQLARSALRQAGGLRSARRSADARPAAGDLCVIDSPGPDAYALPGRPGRIVVTTGMLRSLGPAEREALFAHERAHLAGRHHLHLLVAELAAHCHPGLRPARAAVRLAVERTADEAAAAVTGDRRLTARAIGRAALAASAARTTRPAGAPAATSGPVPQRVAALLAPPHRPHRLAPLLGGLLMLCAGLSLAAAGAGAISLHERIEIAQGEGPAAAHAGGTGSP